MKKIISIIVAITICMSFTTISFAYEHDYLKDTDINDNISTFNLDNVNDCIDTKE